MTNNELMIAINEFAARSDDHDELMRNALANDIDDIDDYSPIDESEQNEMNALLAQLRLPDARELLTDILRSYSLCPLHFHDYAICFDDNDPECASIRLIHPTHDS